MGCYLSSVEPVVNLRADDCPKLKSLESKVTSNPSASNLLSTANSSVIFGTSPQNNLSKSYSKVKAAKNQKTLSQDDEFESVSKFPSSNCQASFQSLKEQIHTNFNQMLTFRNQAVLTPEAFQQDYIFIEKIGNGGEGEVHKVFHKPSGQYRVAKMAKMTKKNFNKGLLQEAQLLGSLDHPNIIKVHEMVKDINQATLTLEYVPGGSLLDHLNHPLFQTYEAIATIMEQILSAVASLHDKGIIHKDIKLENIVFQEANPFSTLKLIDFGYSERKDRSYSKSSSGTIMYMASEVFTMQYNEKVDIWAIGVVLYLLLFKELPFSGKTSEDVVEAIFNKDLNSLFKKQQKLVPNPLVIPFLQKILERDPSRRYSAYEALNDPFIRKFAKRSPIRKADVENYKIYQSKTVMELVFSSIFASNLISFEEQNELVKAFRAIDSDHNGFVEIENERFICSDFRKTLSSFERANSDSTGRLSLSNFITASTNFHTKKDEIRKLFVFLDRDNDMMVKAKDIYQILEGNVDKQILDEMKRYFETYKCYEVSYINFVELLKAF